MPVRRIFGYIGFIFSLVFAFLYVKNQYPSGIGIIGLDLLVISLLIIIFTTLIFYFIGGVIERK
jgi:hypothetical protein